MNRFKIVFVGLVAPLAAGCGSGLNPVKGTVAYEDGSPVTAGMVVVESVPAGEGKRHSANGNVGTDGSFALTTTKSADGVPEGRYRVAVLAPPLSDEQRGRGEKPLVDPRFSDLNTSGLEIEVKSGRNQIELTVAKPGAVKK